PELHGTGSARRRGAHSPDRERTPADVAGSEAGRQCRRGRTSDARHRRRGVEESRRRCGLCRQAARPESRQSGRPTASSRGGRRNVLSHASSQEGEMAIIPMFRCSRMAGSLAFYTQTLDFECVEGDADEPDPTFAVLMREGDPLFLSSHRGDGEFGQAVIAAVDDVDAVGQRFRARGLSTPGNPDAPTMVHEGPIDQTWGTREFYVDDPDGNTVRFVQGLVVPSMTGE